MDQQEILYLNAFKQFSLLGPKSFQKIKKYFKFYKRAWQAPVAEFGKAGLRGKILKELGQKRSKINPEKEIKKLTKLGIGILTIEDKAYPLLLKEIYDPPPLFYYLGNLKIFSDFSLAIVGTRRPSPYGKEVVNFFTQELAQVGFTIISGLALGIDALAHRATLEAKGSTISVLACSLDRIYPPSNNQLGRAILKNNGLIISEYPLGTPALKHHFPVRNRLISGLALGVLVIEATEKSGTLLTANHALEQGREVFTVPGNIFASRSRGCHNLIKMGAKLVTSPTDIVEELELKDIKVYKRAKEVIAESPEEEIILQLIKETPREADKIIKKTGLAPSKINALLTMMEMKGKIKNLGGGVYGLKH